MKDSVECIRALALASVTPGFKFQCHHSEAVWSWTKVLNSLYSQLLNQRRAFWFKEGHYIHIPFSFWALVHLLSHWEWLLERLCNLPRATQLGMYGLDLLHSCWSKRLLISPPQHTLFISILRAPCNVDSRGILIIFHICVELYSEKQTLSPGRSLGWVGVHQNYMRKPYWNIYAYLHPSTSRGGPMQEWVQKVSQIILTYFLDENPLL